MNPNTRAALTACLGVIRMCVGLTSLLWPKTAYRSLGVPATAGPDGGTVTRMFGIRDAAIAAATLSRDPSVQLTGLRLGALADVVDVGSVLLGRRGGAISRGGTMLIGGAAAIFAAVGAAILSDR
jgi:hypothetical protein